MNNTQLYLSIGVPSFVALLSWVTVILAWLSNRSDLNRLSDKVDRLGESLNGKIDSQGESLNGKIDSQGESLKGKIDGQGELLRAEMIAFRREVHADLILLHERVVKVEARQNS